MKIKTSVTLSASTIAAIDELAGSGSNRSRIIEQAVTLYLEQRRRQKRDAQDLDILNRAADRLNKETEDVLTYQVDM